MSSSASPSTSPAPDAPAAGKGVNGPESLTTGPGRLGTGPGEHRSRSTSNPFDPHPFDQQSV